MMVIPISFLNSSPSLCIFKNLTGVPCPGCGTTRGFCSIMQGNFKQAYEYNKFIFITFPLAVIIWGRYLVWNVRKLKA